jgi:predicted kinase
VTALTGALGDGPSRWVKSKVPPPAQALVDQFKAEGQALSKANPSGSSWIEKIDCSKHAAKIVIR